MDPTVKITLQPNPPTNMKLATPILSTVVILMLQIQGASGAKLIYGFPDPEAPISAVYDD